MVLVHITQKSSNKKTGPIPVSTTEESTCPPSCPFINSGCYAKSGPLALHWKKTSNGTQKNLTDWAGLCSFIESLPPGQLMRINQAGDLPRKGDDLDTFLLEQLTKANTGRRAYTYSHHKRNKHNIEAMKKANKKGFTLNASTESLSDADNVIDQGLPAVTVLSSDNENIKAYKGKDGKTYYKVNARLFTPAGRRVVVCPAQTMENATCSTCKLCSKQRNYPIAFIAHGSQKKKVEAVLN